MISQEVAKILYLNTTQNVYLHKIGIATSRNNQSFEDILKTDLCQYFANVDKNFGSSQRTRN